MTDNQKKADWGKVAQTIFAKYGGTDHGDFFVIHCPCSNHTDGKPSCSVRPTADKVLIHCQVCDAEPGSHLAYTALVEAGDIPNARIPYFTQVWEESNKDSVFFEMYLESRGLQDVAMPTSIRVHDHLRHSGTDDEHVAIVCAVTDINEQLVAVHRTYLNNDQNGKLETAEAKMMLGPTRGGHVTLQSGTGTLHIGEGIETMLAVLAHLPELGSHSVWAALSAPNLSAVKIPAGAFQTVHIWADLDSSGTGEKTAQRLAQRLYAEKFIVHIHLPNCTLSDKKSVDWLDHKEKVEDAYRQGTAYAPSKWEEDSAIIPPDYEISQANGVIHLRPGRRESEIRREQISVYPIWIRSQCPDVASLESWFELGYWSSSHQRYHYINVHGSTFVSLRNFQTQLLEKTDISVDLKHQSALCDFLRLCCNLTQRIRPLSDALGWTIIDKIPHFVPCSETVFLKNNSGMYSKLSKAFRTQGTLQGWIENILDPISRCYGASVALGAALASPILHLTNTKSFSVCLTATSDGGKSVSVNAALSMWACAEEIAFDAQSSRVGLDRGLEFFRDLPFLLEESQLQKVDDTLRLLYNVGNSTNTLKGTKDGRLREDSRARGVLFLPGESQLAERLAFDGAAVRLIVINDAPLAELRTEAERDSLADELHEHYGHVGPLLARAIQASYTSGQLKSIFDACKEEFVITEKFQARQRPRYAAMLTGVEFLRGIVGDTYADRIKQAVLRHWDDAAIQKLRTSVARRSLASVMDYYTANPGKFCAGTSVGLNQSFVGELQDDGSLALIRKELKTIFGDEFEVSNVLSEWNNRGWLRLTAAERKVSSTRTRARIGTRKEAWAIVITAETLAEYYEKDTSAGNDGDSLSSAEEH
jgi:hypothetical protein